MKRLNDYFGAVWQIYAAAGASCAVLGALAFMGVVRPAMASRAEQEQRNEELAENRKTAGGLQSTLAVTKRQLETANQTLARNPLRLQPGTGVNRRLADIAELASHCGLSVDEVQPGSVVATPALRTVPIRVVGTGTYPACAAFLHKLRDAFPDTGVSSFEASSNNPTPQAAPASFRFNLAWFTAPAEHPAAK